MKALPVYPAKTCKKTGFPVFTRVEPGVDNGYDVLNAPRSSVICR
jgi:hypothetical protein